MNKKLITVAVASALAAPAVMAEQHTSVTAYGRINNALEFRDISGGTNDWALRNVSSRIGLRGEADLGNGLTAHGRYEFSTFTTREGNLYTTGTGSVSGTGTGGIGDTRIGTVGLSGTWGRVDVGNQWSAFYDTVGTNIDPTYSLGYYLYSSLAGGPYRSSNTIKYSNTFGPVYLEVDLRPAREGANANTEKIGGDGGKSFLDGWGAGMTWNITDAGSIAVAYDNQDVGTSSPLDPPGNVNLGDVERWGVSGKWSFGAIGFMLGWQQSDVKVNGIPGNNRVNQIQGWLTGTVGEKGSWMLGYGQIDYGGNFGNVNSKPSAINLGYYYNMGGGFRLYYEGVFYDSDNSTNVGNNTGFPLGDFSQHLFGMRFDF
jgi:predicted porin